MSELNAEKFNVNALLERFPYGVAIADDQGKISNCNQAASLLFQNNPLLNLDQKRLTIVDRKISREVNQGIVSSVRSTTGLEEGKTFLFQLNQGGDNALIVLVMPFLNSTENKLESSALIMLYQPSANKSPSNELVSALWNLTPAETSLVVDLAKGLSLRECADSQGKSVSTLKSYLKDVFNKMGVNRQADLISMVLTSPAMF